MRVNLEKPHLSFLMILLEIFLKGGLIKKIEGEIHLIAVDSDLFFTPVEDQKTYEMIKPQMESIFYHELISIHGHDAFLIENDAMIKILNPIFKN